MTDPKLEALREACAKVVDEYQDRWNHRDQVARNFSYCAMKIRALDLSAFAGEQEALPQDRQAVDAAEPSIPVSPAPNAATAAPTATAKDSDAQPAESLGAQSAAAPVSPREFVEQWGRLAGILGIDKRGVIEVVDEVERRQEAQREWQKAIIERGGMSEREEGPLIRALRNARPRDGHVGSLSAKDRDEIIGHIDSLASRLQEAQRDLNELIAANDRIGSENYELAKERDAALREAERTKEALGWLARMITAEFGGTDEKIIAEVYRRADAALAKRGEVMSEKEKNWKVVLTADEQRLLKKALIASASPREEGPTPKRWYQYEMPPTDEPLKRWIMESDYDAIERRLQEAQQKSRILTNIANSYRDTYTIEQKRADAALRERDAALRALREERTHWQQEYKRWKDERDAALREVEEHKRDAERWREIRKAPKNGRKRDWLYMPHTEELDASIDAALAERGKG